MKLAFRALGYTLVIVAVAAWVGYLYLFLAFSNTRPPSPQPELGRAIALNNHGRAVYVTGFENELLNWLSYGALVTFVAGAIAVMRSQSTPPK
jgi:hypothetical protein